MALRRLAASFYDNLNQFPASQKEGHKFKMRCQLHNQCKGLLKRHIKFCQGRFDSWNTQFTITNMALSVLIKFKLDEAEHPFVIHFSVFCQWYAQGTI